MTWPPHLQFASCGAGKDCTPEQIILRFLNGPLLFPLNNFNYIIANSGY